MAIEINKNSYLNLADLLEFEGTQFWEVPDFPEVVPQQNDKYVDIDDRYIGRMDLLAFDFYGDVDLWWIIALANNIDLVPTGLKFGSRIRIPNKSYVDTLLARGVK